MPESYIPRIAGSLPAAAVLAQPSVFASEFLEVTSFDDRSGCTDVSEGISEAS